MLHRQRNARIWHIHDRIDALAVPLTSDARAEIGVVPMIRGDKLDRLAEYGTAEIIDRHARGLDRAGAPVRGIKRGHIGEHANLNGLFFFSCRASCQCHCHGGANHCPKFH